MPTPQEVVNETIESDKQAAIATAITTATPAATNVICTLHSTKMKSKQANKLVIVILIFRAVYAIWCDSMTASAWS